MAGKSVVRKVFINKRNNQLSVSLSRKQMKKLDPSIKFNRDLFVELKVIKEKK